jgi:hypothetical protein
MSSSRTTQVLWSLGIFGAQSYKQPIQLTATPIEDTNTMATSALAPAHSFSLTLMEKTPEKKTNFGAVVTDIDLDNISGAHSSFKLIALGSC